MNLEDLEEILSKADVDPRHFSIGSERHEALCLVQHGPEFRVFTFESGDRYEEKKFESEDSACVHFLKRVFEVWHRKDEARIPTVKGTRRDRPVQAWGLVWIPFIASQAVWIMLTFIRGLDSLVVYFAVVVALCFTFGSVLQARTIRRTPDEREPGYLVAGKKAVVFSTVFLYLAGLSGWMLLVFGRGRITSGFLVYGTSAAVISLLSVVNAWRTQPDQQSA